jgi:hypothetical protein
MLINGRRRQLIALVNFNRHMDDFFMHRYPVMHFLRGQRPVVRDNA